MQLMDLMGFPQQQIRRRPVSGTQRFMPMGPFGIPGQSQTTGGYDSSGINPHGMYGGTFGQMQRQPFPQNPGGFQPMGLARLLGRY